MTLLPARRNVGALRTRWPRGAGDDARPCRPGDPDPGGLRTETAGSTEHDSWAGAGRSGRGVGADTGAPAIASPRSAATGAAPGLPAPERAAGAKRPARRRLSTRGAPGIARACACPRAGRAPVPGPTAKVVYVKPQRANLREGGGTSMKILRVLRQGTRLEVLEERSEWFRVRLEDGQEGWVAASVTAPTAP